MQTIEVSRTPLGEYQRAFLEACARDRGVYENLGRSERVELQLGHGPFRRGAARRAVFALAGGGSETIQYGYVPEDAGW